VRNGVVAGRAGAHLKLAHRVAGELSLRAKAERRESWHKEQAAPPSARTSKMTLAGTPMAQL
jgi:hypothetical protein